MIQVPDDEAFEERKAIMAEAHPKLAPFELSRRAMGSLYSSPWSKILTAAANGDWAPAERYYKDIQEREGSTRADEKMNEIRTRVEKELRAEEIRQNHSSADLPWVGKPRSRKRR